MPCRVDGCTKTWTWWGSEQIRALGQDPPKRMCDEHLAAFHELEDKEIECRNPGCHNTWTWKRGAQLHQLSRHGDLKTPRRMCDLCAGDTSNLRDQEVECRLPGCAHTWTWTADAQHRHAMWLRRERAKIEKAERKAEEAEAAEAAAPEAEAAAPEAEAAAPEAETAAAAPEAVADDEASESESESDDAEGSDDAVEADGAEEGPGKKRRRRRRRKKKKRAEAKAQAPAKALPEGPPQKLCGHCSERLAAMTPTELPCKVHGCDQMWSWDVGSQLRAWVQARDAEGNWPSEAPKGPRRMCNRCRDFCRQHKDREVVCGKPECEKTWTYKTGAQLQDHLAGRNADPIKLCPDCVRSQFVPSAMAAALPEGAEIMPCAVSGCEGKWVYVPGMELAPSPEDGSPAPDRMCNPCRAERELEPRLAPPAPEPVEPAAESTTAVDAAPGEAAGEAPGEAAGESAGESASEGGNSVDASPEPSAEATTEATAEPTADASTPAEGE